MGDSSPPPSVLAPASPPLLSTTEMCGVLTREPASPPEDPSCSIRGMYRLLDLITEQGNNGLGISLLVSVYTTFTISSQLIKS